MLKLQHVLNYYLNATTQFILCIATLKMELRGVAAAAAMAAALTVLYCIVLYLQLVLNPKSYGRA